MSRTRSAARRTFLTQVAALATVGTLDRLQAVLGAEPKSDRSTGSSSARGRVLDVKSDIQEYKDPDTGVRVLRLAAGDFDNVHPYFTTTSFVGDGHEQIVFGSNRTGAYQFYLLELRSGRLVQLTDSEKVSPTDACVDPSGQLFYFSDGVLRAVKTDGTDDRELYRSPEGFRSGLPTCTADGRYVAFAYGERLTQSTNTGKIYSGMPESLFQRPRCMVIRVDTTNGEAVAAWGEAAWMSHVLIHPTQPNLILFCHEGGSNVKQRMWIVDIDERPRQPRPLYVQRPGENCTHEYFTRQGDVGFQCYSSVERHEGYNAFIRPDGTWIRQYLLPGTAPRHIQSNSDNSLLVGDCGYRDRKEKDGSSWMSLMTHPNGRVEVRRLCRHNTSWKTQNSHPHAVFSPDDQWVVFNSDDQGRNNVYLAEVTSLG
jgi:oligogalacturonide lyase